MLTYDPDSRISWEDLYKHDYIQPEDYHSFEDELYMTQEVVQGGNFTLHKKDN